MSAPPPTGTVTLVFTDVQGSTVLWERAPEAMRVGLAQHDALLRRLLAEECGYEVKTEGDAFMVAFGSGSEALGWCLRVQEELPRLEWPEALLAQPEAARDEGGIWGGLRVRMGAHCGAPDCRRDPTSGRMDYFGPVVNRAARVSGVAHGGQVLVSEAVMQQLDPRPEGAAVEELGEVCLKGLGRPERLTQILPPALARRRFPPPRAEGARRSNLTPDGTRFIGREGELAKLERHLAEGERVLTLLGPGGTGKTRLARALARRLLEADAGVATEAWFVDLSPARSAGEVLRGLAAALGSTMGGGGSEEEQRECVAAALAARTRPLLVLDNCEQVVEPVARLVAALRAKAPEVRWLATSRVPLGLGEELRVPLAPLDAAEASQLFVDRASRYGATEAELVAESEALAALVERLDRLPLAIELAASRAGVLGPEALLAGLDRRLDMLRSRRVDLPARHASMRAALDWSWELLSEPERAALARAAVFPASFTLAAAEKVLGAEVEVVEALVEASLLARRGGRFALLETMRSYAAEQLPPDELERARARHLAYCLDLADGVTRGKYEAIPWRREVKALASEAADLRAARDFARETEPDAAARLTLALGELSHGQGWILALQGHARVAVELAPRVELGRRAQLLHLASISHWLSGELEKCDAVSREAEELAERAGDPALAADLRCTQGGCHLIQGRYAVAEADLQAALERARADGIPSVEVRSLGNLAHVSYRQSRFRQAESRAHEMLARSRESGQDWALGIALTNLGAARLALGDWEAALATYAEALVLHRQNGDWRQQFQTRCSVAFARLMRDEPEVGVEDVEDCLAQAREMGFLWAHAHAHHTLGMIELLRASPEEACRSLEAALEPGLRAGDRNMEALVRSCLAPALAHSGRGERAEVELARARELLGEAGEPSVALFAASVALGRAGNEEELASARADATRLLAKDAASEREDVASRELARRVLRRWLG